MFEKFIKKITFSLGKSLVKFIWFGIATAPVIIGFKNEIILKIHSFFANIKYNTISSCFQSFKNISINMPISFFITLIVCIIAYKYIARKIDKIGTATYFSQEIEAIKFLYNFLWNYPYNDNSYVFFENNNYKYTQNFGGNTYPPMVLQKLNTLIRLTDTIYEEEDLKHSLYSFQNMFIQKQIAGLGTEYMSPNFASRVEFLKEKDKIKKNTDKIIKYLKYNRVS